ncbi:MAG: hypothetical protein WC030_03880 [Candidatus Paceibacterota bacterium]
MKTFVRGLAWTALWFCGVTFLVVFFTWIKSDISMGLLETVGFFSLFVVAVSISVLNFVKK